MLPKEIKIGSRTIPVEVKKIDSQFMGLYSGKDQAIYIQKGLSPAQELEVFIHEMIHAMMDYARFDMDMRREMENKNSVDESVWNLEEILVEDFSTLFLQVMKDNNLFGAKIA